MLTPPLIRLAKRGTATLLSSALLWTSAYSAPNPSQAIRSDGVHAALGNPLVSFETQALIQPYLQAWPGAKPSYALHRLEGATHRENIPTSEDSKRGNHSRKDSTLTPFDIASLGSAAEAHSLTPDILSKAIFIGNGPEGVDVFTVPGITHFGLGSKVHGDPIRNRVYITSDAPPYPRLREAHKVLLLQTAALRQSPTYKKHTPWTSIPLIERQEIVNHFWNYLSEQGNSFADQMLSEIDVVASDLAKQSSRNSSSDSSAGASNVIVQEHSDPEFDFLGQIYSLAFDHNNFDLLNGALKTGQMLGLDSVKIAEFVSLARRTDPFLILKPLEFETFKATVEARLGELLEQKKTSSNTPKNPNSLFYRWLIKKQAQAAWKSKQHTPLSHLESRAANLSPKQVAWWGMAGALIETGVVLGAGTVAAFASPGLAVATMIGILAGLIAGETRLKNAELSLTRGTPMNRRETISFVAPKLLAFLVYVPFALTFFDIGFNDQFSLFFAATGHLGFDALQIFEKPSRVSKTALHIQPWNSRRWLALALSSVAHLIVLGVASSIQVVDVSPFKTTDGQKIYAIHSAKPNHGTANSSTQSPDPRAESDPHGVRSIMPAEMSTRTVPEGEYYDLARLGHTPLYHLLFRFGAEMSEALDAIAIFAEDKNYRGQVLSQAEISAARGTGKIHFAGDYGYRDGHNLAIKTFAEFFTKAEQKGLPLNPAVRRLKEDLLQREWVLRTATGYQSSAIIYVLASSQDYSRKDRERVSGHEQIHGLLEIDPKMADKIHAITSRMGRKSREPLRHLLGYLDYSDDVSEAETAAYLSDLSVLQSHFASLADATSNGADPRNREASKVAASFLEFRGSWVGGAYYLKESWKKTLVPASAEIEEAYNASLSRQGLSGPSYRGRQGGKREGRIWRKPIPKAAVLAGLLDAAMARRGGVGVTATLIMEGSLSELLGQIRTDSGRTSREKTQMIRAVKREFRRQRLSKDDSLRLSISDWETARIELEKVDQVFYSPSAATPRHEASITPHSTPTEDTAKAARQFIGRPGHSEAGIAVLPQWLVAFSFWLQRKFEQRRNFARNRPTKSDTSGSKGTVTDISTVRRISKPTPPVALPKDSLYAVVPISAEILQILRLGYFAHPDYRQRPLEITDRSEGKWALNGVTNDHVYLDEVEFGGGQTMGIREFLVRHGGSIEIPKVFLARDPLEMRNESAELVAPPMITPSIVDSKDILDGSWGELFQLFRRLWPWFRSIAKWELPEFGTLFLQDKKDGSLQQAESSDERAEGRRPGPLRFSLPAGRAREIGTFWGGEVSVGVFPPLERAFAIVRGVDEHNTSRVLAWHFINNPDVSSEENTNRLLMGLTGITGKWREKQIVLLSRDDVLSYPRFAVLRAATGTERISVLTFPINRGVELIATQEGIAVHLSPSASALPRLATRGSKIQVLPWSHFSAPLYGLRDEAPGTAQRPPEAPPGNDAPPTLNFAGAEAARWFMHHSPSLMLKSMLSSIALAGFAQAWVRHSSLSWMGFWLSTFVVAYFWPRIRAYFRPSSISSYVQTLYARAA